MSADVPLAVIGVACRFPGANDRAQFWDNIARDVYSIRPMPPSRFHRDRYFDPEVGAYGKSYCDLGGLLDERPFDPAPFRIPPKVAESTDIAQLWALEVARDTLKDAGFDQDGLTGQDVGVVIGHARGSMLTSDMAFGTAVEGMIEALDARPDLFGDLSATKRKAIERVHAAYPKRTEDGGTGTIASALAGRITSTFGLTGRHMVVDAACASSLAAIDLGARAVRRGHMKMALVGGASYSQELSVILFAQSRALSPDGSFPFDRRANGFISSDGMGFLLICRLDHALQQGLQVRAVLRGVGGSCDGKGRALWAPRKEGQILAMQRAYRQCGVDPASIGLIEAHATSTPIGDATEVQSLNAVYGGRADKLPIGSVKGNIGHCREAAGVAGVIKAICALEHATIPPTGNFRNANEEIPWNDVCVQVSTESRPWTHSGPEPRRAGVNAFGIGGLNYHVIVEEPPAKTNTSVTVQDDLQAPASGMPARAPIAIVGIGGRLPGASSVDKFWSNLTNGADFFGEVPNDRWSRQVYYKDGERTPYRTYATRGAFIEDFEANWRRYKVPPKLVERNDPLQFMLLESAMDAVDDAGIDLKSIDRERAAVLMGTVFGSDYALNLSLSIRALELAEVVAEAEGKLDDATYVQQVADTIRDRLPSINEDSSGSFSSSTLASRVAKTLDLMGPTYTMDAACASSLASLDAACDLLADQEVDLVLWGGGDRAMRVQRYEAYCQFHAISKKQAPSPFDAGADGFLPGEGAMVMALMRLDDAEAAGHPIHAVVRGVGSSSDGERKSLHKPSPRGLARAMTRALEQAQIDPEHIPFIECHGGGTPSGDATEAEAIRSVYLQDSRKDPIVIGAIKSNVGHTQGAAGAISIAKTALALENESLPPTLRFQKPHQDHRFEDGIRVNTETESYPRNGGTRRFGAVSAMGLGGINYHVVLEQGPGKKAKSVDQRDEAWRFVHSVRAPNAEALGALLRSVDASTLASQKHVGKGPAIATLVAGDETELESRRSTAQKAGLLKGTRDFLSRQGIFVRTSAPRPGKTCFLFSGQGSQYPGMARALYDNFLAATEIADRCDRWLTAQGRSKLTDVMFSDAIEGVFEIQASILCADVMAYAALRSIGVEADCVTGHSFGDYAAMVAAEAWTLEDALAATVVRANAIESSVAPGAMASVIASPDKVQEILRALPADSGIVEASNINAPSQVVLSGSPEGLDAALEACAAAGIETRRLPIPRAFHSTLMGAAKSALAEGLQQIEIQRPKLAFMSSVTGRLEEDPSAIRQALIDQLVLPVNFIGQIESLVASGHRVFVESGPRGVLAGLTRQIISGQEQENDIDVITTDDADRPGPWALGRVLAMTESRHGSASASSAEGTDDTPVMTPSEIDRARAVLLLEGDEASTLLDDAAFAEFWARTRPSIAALVKSLWDSERPRPAELIEEAQANDTAIEPAEPDEASVAPELSSVPKVDRDEVRQFLLDAICEQTGYPPDIIEMDADLEADLGIDTVKQAQVFGKLRDRYNLKADESVSLRDFPSMNHILSYVDKQLTAKEAAAPRPKISIPTIDITQRRSQRPQKVEVIEIPELAEDEPVLESAQPVEHVESAKPEPVQTVSEAPKTESTSDHYSQPELQLPSAVQTPVLEKPQSDLHEARKVTRLDLFGTSREIGRAHGEAMKDDILEMLDRYEAFLGTQGLTMTSVPDAIRILPALFDEESLEEIRGLADATGAPFEFLLAYNLDTALFPAFSTGCTQAMRTAENNGGQLLHLANEDSPLMLHLGGKPQARVVQIRQRTDAPFPSRRTVHFSLAGQICGINAANDAGLTITSCTLLDRAPPVGLPSGLPHPQVVKRMIEQASSLNEAMLIARQSERSGRWSLLVSDADRDEAAYLEYDGDTLLLEGRVPGSWVSTNHAISGQSHPDHPVPEHSALRAKRANELVQKEEPLSVSDAQEILRDRYDAIRNREVKHPTMNTVRRVDNVMSLIVDGKARRLYMTDRVEPAGAPAGDRAEFTSIDYGFGSHTAPPPRGPGHGSSTPAPSTPASSASTPSSSASTARANHAPPVHLASVTQLPAQGRGVVPKNEVMRRYVMRVIPEPAPVKLQEFKSHTALLIGDNERVRQIAGRLKDRGATTVRIVPNCNRAFVELERLGGPSAVDTVGFVLDAPPNKRDWALDAEDWANRKVTALSGPFEFLRTYTSGRAQPTPRPSTLFAVTVLGGALGVDNVVQGAPECGALVGLCKAVRREFDNFTVQVLDTSPSAGPAQVAKALLTELDAGSPRLEVGLLRKTRVRLAMAPQPAAGWSGGSGHLPSSWVVTGGARGVTAKICERLAALYQPILHLVGRHALPEPEELERLRSLNGAGIDAEKQALLSTMRRDPTFTPRDWTARCEALDKTLEIDQTIRTLAELGSQVVYHAVDCSDRNALALSLEAARNVGPIEGIIHGAGYELAKPFDKKTNAIFDATVGGKVDGLVHLLALTAQDTLSHVVAFSSVSGRFGGHGQTDYSAANEAVSRLIGTYAAGRPEVHAAAISWPAWSEVGLAARSSSREFLERSGQKFMSPDEGANHFIRELWAGLPENEVVICERLEALDLDRLLPREDQIARWQELDRRALASPMLGHIVSYESDDHLMIERVLISDEPFLDQHRMGPNPILPAVIGLEMMAEIATLGGGHHALADVTIENPLKVRPSMSSTARVVREGDDLRITACARRPDGVVLEPERVHLRGRRVDPVEIENRELPPWEGEPSPFPYPRSIDRSRGSRLMYHGPVFRCLEGVVPHEGGGMARLVVPPVEALVAGSPAQAWLLPAALLDGCLQAAGLLGRILFNLSGLPIGFDRVNVSPRATRATGETVTLEVKIRPHGEDELKSDLYAMGTGGPLLHVEGYRAKVLRGL